MLPYHTGVIVLRKWTGSGWEGACGRIDLILEGMIFEAIPGIDWYYSVLSLKKQENVYIIHGTGKKKGVSLHRALHMGVST